MYVTYKGTTYVIEESFSTYRGNYYDLGDPDGRKETLFNVLKEKCSEARYLYDEDEWLEDRKKNMF